MYFKGEKAAGFLISKSSQTLNYWIHQKSQITQSWNHGIGMREAGLLFNWMCLFYMLFSNQNLTWLDFQNHNWPSSKVHLVKATVFPVVMYRCESWTIKKAEQRNWCFWTLVLEKTLQSPLDCKEIQPVHPKGNQSWVFIGRTDVEVETPIFWPPDAKTWLIWKDPDVGKDWGQEEKGTTEDEMVRWHHQLNGHEFG